MRYLRYSFQVLEQLEDLREGAVTDLHAPSLQAGRRNVKYRHLVKQGAFNIFQSSPSLWT